MAQNKNTNLQARLGTGTTRPDSENSVDNNNNISDIEPTNMQSVMIDVANNQVSGTTPLVLPIELIFNDVPVQLPADNVSACQSFFSIDAPRLLRYGVCMGFPGSGVEEGRRSITPSERLVKLRPFFNAL